jgi:cell division protein ZapA (FtsZ GTPase activity inhibitor)
VAKRTVSIEIQGQEFRVRIGENEDEATLVRTARYLDETMAHVGAKTGTVDSHGVALLTALNLAREIVELRDGRAATGGDPERLRALIELAEGALEGALPAA